MTTKRNSKKGSAGLTSALKELGAAAIAQMQVREHELKCWPENFAASIAGLKPFEIRRDDRGFLAGDQLRLREWIPTVGLLSGRYTGRELFLHVTYVVRNGFGVRDGYCAMSVQSVNQVAA